MMSLTQVWMTAITEQAEQLKRLAKQYPHEAAMTSPEDIREAAQALIEAAEEVERARDNVLPW